MGGSVASSWETLASKTWLKKSRPIPAPWIWIALDLDCLGFAVLRQEQASSLEPRVALSPAQPEQQPRADRHYVTAALHTPLSFLPPPEPASAEGTGATEPPWECAGESVLISSACSTALHLLVKADGPFLPPSCCGECGLKSLSENHLFEEALISSNRSVSIWEQTCQSTSGSDHCPAMGQLQHLEAFHLPVAVLPDHKPHQNRVRLRLPLQSIYIKKKSVRKYKVRQIHVCVFFSRDSVQVLCTGTGLKNLKLISSSTKH